MKLRSYFWTFVALFLLAGHGVGCAGLGTDVGNPEDFAGTYRDPAFATEVGNPGAGDVPASAPNMDGTNSNGAPLPACSDDAQVEKSIVLDATHEDIVWLTGFFDYAGLPEVIPGVVSGGVLQLAVVEPSIALFCSGVLESGALNFVCDVTISDVTTACELTVNQQ